MGRWIKDNWWVVLGVLGGALEVVFGIGLPFEDRTLGSVFGGIAIASLGLLALAGTQVRRRPGRRAVGDVMVAAGMLPMFPFFWTIVAPLIGLGVVVGAAPGRCERHRRRRGAGTGRCAQ